MVAYGSLPCLYLTDRIVLTLVLQLLLKSSWQQKNWFLCAHLDNDRDSGLGLVSLEQFGGILDSGRKGIPKISGFTHPSHPETGSSIFVRILHIVLIIFYVIPSVENLPFF